MNWEITNDEIRMTNQLRNRNDEFQKNACDELLGDSRIFDFRHLSIRH